MGHSTTSGYRDSKNEIMDLIQAQYPFIYVVSDDELPVIKTLATIAEEKLPEDNYEVMTWNIASGFYCESGENTTTGFEVKDGNVEEKVEALFKTINNSNKNTIYVLQDFDFILQEIKFTGLKLKELVHSIKKPIQVEKAQKRHILGKKTQPKKHIIVVSSNQYIPAELEKLVNLVYFGMPGKDELGEIVDIVAERNNEVLNTEERAKIIKASLGLTESEVENALMKSIVASENGKISAKVITSLKEQAVKKTGIIEFITTSERVEDVGGMRALFDYISRRTIAFNDEIRNKRNLPYPKGVFLTGVQGCGKSHAMKAIANFLEIPLVRLDMGSLMEKYVGESDKKLKRLINLLESIAPVMLWIDEIEKGFPNPNSPNTHEVSNRMLQTVLTWFQEKTSPVFVGATANNIESLPPELIRKGRFDEIFFIDLPKEEERGDIFKIHLSKRKIDTAEIDLRVLVEKTEGYSGAEIEALVNEANFQSAFDECSVSTEYLLKEIERTTPLSIIRQDRVEAIRQWAISNKVRTANL